MDNRLTQTLIKKSHTGSSTLGLALGGGGARGFAHAGALQAIDEEGIKIDILAGCSAGSIVAVLYAAGLKPETILKMFVDARFLDLAEFSFRRGGMLSIDRCLNYLTRALGSIRNLEDLKIPTVIGVTNFDSGEPAMFDHGPIGPIVKASCSIPIAIEPVIIDGTTYVDGGVLHNLPAWTIRHRCDKLIGVNISPLMSKGREYKSLLPVALRAYTLISKSNQAQDMEMCDIAITMEEISKHKVFSLKDIDKVYENGYIKMKEKLKKCREFIFS